MCSIYFTAMTAKNIKTIFILLKQQTGVITIEWPSINNIITKLLVSSHLFHLRSLLQAEIRIQIFFFCLLTIKPFQKLWNVRDLYNRRVEYSKYTIFWQFFFFFFYSICATPTKLSTCRSLWISRLAQSLKRFLLVRIDFFRGKLSCARNINCKILYNVYINVVWITI